MILARKVIKYNFNNISKTFSKKGFYNLSLFLIIFYEN